MEHGGLSFGRVCEMSIWYRGAQVGARRVDFLVEEVVLVELKAVVGLDDLHTAQGIELSGGVRVGCGVVIEFGGDAAGVQAVDEGCLKRDGVVFGLDGGLPCTFVVGWLNDDVVAVMALLWISREVKRMTTARTKRSSSESDVNGATTGYEDRLWQMADALRGSMDAAEYKHVVLGLLFLKYVSDAFEEARVELEAEGRFGCGPRRSGPSIWQITCFGCRRKRVGIT